MRLTRHVLPRASLLALARNQADADVLRQIAAGRRSRDLLLLKALVTLSARSGRRGQAITRQAFRLLVRLDESAPKVTRSVVHHPAVSSWLHHTVRLLMAGDETAAPAELAAVAAAAAVRAGHPLDIEWPATVVALPGLGSATFSRPGVVRARSTPGEPAAAVLTSGDETVLVPRDRRVTAERWQHAPLIGASHRGLFVRLELGTFTLAEEADLRFADDQLTSAEAIAHWQDCLTHAWRRLVDRHRQVADEVTELVTLLAPLRVTGIGRAGATPDNAFGAIALSPPPDAGWLALTLAHEVQHVKLTALTDMITFAADNEQGAVFYAPWRSDPRPVIGMIHGAFAHLGVARFWRDEFGGCAGATANEGEVEFARWSSAARSAIGELIDKARLTDAGEVFVRAMAEAADELCAVGVSPTAADTAERLRSEHHRAWRTVHGDTGKGI